jgi:hypothetical protein
MASRKRARGTVERARKFLTERALCDNWRAIERALAGKRNAWGLQGWAIKGREQLRVVVKVPFRRVQPRARVAALRIEGNPPFLLKVGVEATFCRGDAVSTRGGHSGALRSQTFPLAPGAPIVVASGGKSRCGIAAVLDLDGDPFLLTCGHTFNSDTGKVFVPGRSEPIAKLTRNLFDDHHPFDAAICELTARGKELLQDSDDADTWFDSVHTPGVHDNDESAIFWPTSEEDPDPIEVEIASFSARFDPLFGPRGPQAGFIQINMPAAEGDSGSALAFDNSLYGLCSGTAGSSAFFTPIADVAHALRSDFRSIKPWQPS